jgi:amino acid adenylation domain-containing protein
VKERIFQELLKEGLTRHPEAVALERGQIRMTYQELDRQSTIMARWLIKRGLPAEGQVALLMKDRVKIVVSVIGVLKARGVFVILDPSLPEERLTRMMDTVDLDRTVTDTCEVFEAFAGDKDDETTGTFDREYCPEDRIYIYFTSGTTGDPKAIVGKNKSLHHFIQWEAETFEIDRVDRFSQLIHPGFDAFLRDVFVPLTRGGTVCLPPEEGVLQDPDALVEFLDKAGVTAIHCVPSLFRIILESAPSGDIFKDLRYIFLSGEKILSSDLSRWYGKFQQRVQLVNFYGPTETTMIKTFHRLQPSDMEGEHIPIGSPMKGARLLVLDQNLKPCQRLAVGEIYIRTPFASHGYYKNSRLNKERFIPNPLSQNPNDLLFKTGDLGRVLADGSIELLGRSDRQVKIRGIRVELDEIEEVMRSSPDVDEAVVTYRESGQGRWMLGGYITIAESCGNGADHCLASLNEYLGLRLPEYMIPDNIQCLDSIPTRLNGKIDYDGLPLPEIGLDAVPPQTPLEEKLFRIWSDILRTTDFGTEHKFFNLGGNSLNVLSLISLVHREFDKKLTLQEIFRHDTIKKQAELLQTADDGEFESISPAEKRDYYEASSVQRRLYSLQQLEPESKSYNLPLVGLLQGEIDDLRFQKAFSAVIQRHESFRTAFVFLDGIPKQRIFQRVESDIEYHDVGDDSTHEQEIISAFVRPFDLSQPPLLRAGLIRRNHNTHILMIDAHHSIIDGTSQGILMNDLLNFYNGTDCGPPPLQYKDVTQWRESRRGDLRWIGAMRRQERYWADRFSGDLPLLDLPLDFPRPEVRTFEGADHGFMVEPETAERLAKFCKSQEVTLFMALLAIYTVTLSKLAGSEDVVVGTSAAGRTHADLQGIVGMFVNAVALRNFPHRQRPFDEFLHEVKANTLAAFDNQDYQFETLVKDLNIPRIPGRNPVFDVMMVLNNEEIPDMEMPGLSLADAGYRRTSAQMDLKLRAYERRAGIFFTIEYDNRLFRPHTIEMFGKNFIEVLEAALDNPSIRLGDIPISHGLSATQKDTDALEFGF